MENASTLHDAVTESIQDYFKQLQPNYDGNDIYDNFLAKIEEPLFKTVLNICRGNQSKAAKYLGLSRGTLRKKLKQYDML